MITRYGFGYDLIAGGTDKVTGETGALGWQNLELENLAGGVNISWYIVLSSLLFAIGAVGILVRRSPIVILLCLELMLNAGNLALVAFSREVGNQQGQVFALVVMVVAACEVVVGLGLLVAIFRRKLPMNVDDLRELRG